MRLVTDVGRLRYCAAPDTETPRAAVANARGDQIRGDGRRPSCGKYVSQSRTCTYVAGRKKRNSQDRYPAAESENQGHQSSCSADGSQHQSTDPATQSSPMDWGSVLWDGNLPLEGVLGPEFPGQQSGSDCILGAEADFGPEPICSFDTGDIQETVFPPLLVESLEGGDPGVILTSEPCYHTAHPRYTGHYDEPDSGKDTHFRYEDAARSLCMYRGLDIQSPHLRSLGGKGLSGSVSHDPNTLSGTDCADGVSDM
ncbi:hypothetical protein F5Y07DRAFT_359948, partial [Xylaria sp. FL0933]